jgi:hypothetical protein
MRLQIFFKARTREQGLVLKYQFLILELTRIRGHLIFWEGGVGDGEVKHGVPAGVSGWR